MIQFLELLIDMIRNAYAVLDNDRRIIGLVEFDGTFIPIDDTKKGKSKQEIGLTLMIFR